MVATALLVLVLPREASAQVRAADVRETLQELRSAYFEFAKRETPLRDNSPALNNLLKRLLTAIDWLNNRVATTDPAAVSREYLRSLERAADLLKQMKAPGKLNLQIAADLADELEAKVEHCRLLGVGMGGSIVLRINTRRPTGPAPDLQVMYLLKIYEHVKGGSPVTFPRLSTPTEATLEPGRYLVWARDPATGRTSERALVRVVGQKELLVDLPVP